MRRGVLPAIAVLLHAAQSGASGEIIPGVRLEQTRSAILEVMPRVNRIAGGPEGFASAPDMERLSFQRVAIRGLAHPVDGELRFWNGRLWALIVFFGENETPAVQSFLAERFGEKRVWPQQPVWRTAAYTVTAELTHRWFALQSAVISAEVQTWLLDDIRRQAGVEPTAAVE